jgi:hypothetical protein
MDACSPAGPSWWSQFSSVSRVQCPAYPVDHQHMHTSSLSQQLCDPEWQDNTHVCSTTTSGTGVLALINDVQRVLERSLVLELYIEAGCNYTCYRFVPPVTCVVASPRRADIQWLKINQRAF